jgi:ATP-dependent helicase/nuclease subunit B
VNEKMVEIGKKSRQGEIEKKPFKKEEQTGCTYCSYRGICGFDVSLPGYNYEKIELSESEAMDKIVSKE